MLVYSAYQNVRYGRVDGGRRGVGADRASTENMDPRMDKENVLPCRLS